ncbi:DNA-methyltransferase [Metapseudomonas furukawaii]|uniref:Methyltransferase n=1 Tax=Metapseudomonas furukawaii TaxID=1149133 RepID=A0AAD1C502_METFU|nr:site-specific DNA-methyltransferase [Pseudomonas furukawaii]ELS25649.1 Adenine-specific methyltransferase [Pseudomonas furukawaii]BAU76162.1 adenine-specific methyltransferase [Pseudomonas furukawaii]
MSERYQLHLGDCLVVMRSMDDNSVDSIVTDPPYGLSFMGKRWDCDVPAIEVWAECLRVLKPGGHLLAFAGTRTQHRMAVRIEDAGFEIRDLIAWVYGSGFPKSRNLDGDWQGWGTALKPAMEPITIARKPLAGTVAANVLAHGTGALNIDGCRIPAEAMQPNTGAGGLPRRRPEEQRGAGVVAQPHPSGRWPANLIHDGSAEVVEAFPDETGASAPVKGTEPTANGFSGAVKYSGMLDRVPGAFHGDSGSAARFFYCPKTSRLDRNEGCEDMERKPLHWSSGDQNPGSFQSAGTDKSSQNHHPTVKPTDLMAYLCRLVTPPGGTVLDPFMGSGSTGKAAMREGFRFIGCELSPEYFAIAQARIGHELDRANAAIEEAAARAAQLDIFAITPQEDAA